MAKENIQRRLAAIMAADVVGYRHKAAVRGVAANVAFGLKAESRASPEIGRCRSPARPIRSSVPSPLYIPDRNLEAPESAPRG